METTVRPQEGCLFLKSEAKSYNKDMQCVICYSTGVKPLRTAKMMSMKASLHEMSQNYFELLICLGNIAQVKYHSDRYLKKLFTINRCVMESTGIN